MVEREKMKREGHSLSPVLFYWRERSCGIRPGFCIYLLLALLTVVLADCKLYFRLRAYGVEQGKVSQIDPVRCLWHIDDMEGGKL